MSATLTYRDGWSEPLNPSCGTSIKLVIAENLLVRSFVAARSRLGEADGRRRRLRREGGYWSGRFDQVKELVGALLHAGFGVDRGSGDLGESRGADRTPR